MIMSGDTLFQIFLYLQIFVMGALAAVAARYAYIHFKSSSSSAAPVTPHAPQQQNEPLPPVLKERLLEASQIKFQDVLNNSAIQLQQGLEVTNGHINNLVLRLATEIVSGELERYRNDLDKLHKQAEKNMAGISEEVAKHKAEVEAKITQEIEAEKQRLIKQIDTKLADAMGSFLAEALQHNVDLGSQSAYLVSLLEEHKADFIKEVGSEDKTAG